MAFHSLLASWNNSLTHASSYRIEIGICTLECSRCGQPFVFPYFYVSFVVKSPTTPALIIIHLVAARLRHINDTFPFTLSSIMLSLKVFFFKNHSHKRVRVWKPSCHSCFVKRDKLKLSKSHKPNPPPIFWNSMEKLVICSITIQFTPLN